MTPVTLSFDWKDVNQTAASRALGHNFNPKWWQTIGLLVGGAAFAWYFDWMVLETDGLGGFLGFLFGVYACIAWNAIRFRKMTDGIATSPARSGGVTVVFEQDGYRVTTALTESFSKWSTVTEITPAKDMIVLAVGTVEYLPILDAALPYDMTRGDMMAMLEELTA